MINARFKHRIDTLENWEALNPILLKGEIAVVVLSSNDIKIKIGNTDNSISSHFNNIPYVNNSLESLINIIGNDYLDSQDKAQFYNDFIEIDELSLDFDENSKSIKLNIYTGPNSKVLSTSLSNFIISSDLLSYQPKGEYLSANSDITTSAQVSSIVEDYNFTKTIFRKWTIEQE